MERNVRERSVSSYLILPNAAGASFKAACVYREANLRYVHPQRGEVCASVLVKVSILATSEIWCSFVMTICKMWGEN